MVPVLDLCHKFVNPFNTLDCLQPHSRVARSLADVALSRLKGETSHIFSENIIKTGWSKHSNLINIPAASQTACGRYLIVFLLSLTQVWKTCKNKNDHQKTGSIQFRNKAAPEDAAVSYACRRYDVKTGYCFCHSALLSLILSSASLHNSYVCPLGPYRGLEAW